MPVSISCPSCQKRLSVPDHAAGRTFNCPKCNGLLIVPNVAVQQPPTASFASPQQIVPVASAADDMPREPWFFGFISFVAYLDIVLSLAGFAIFFFILATTFGRAWMETKSVAFAVASIVGSLYLLIALIVSIFGAALILLVLDMARSFRFLRRNRL
jgi:hypothetical protein